MTYVNRGLSCEFEKIKRTFTRIKLGREESVSSAGTPKMLK